MEKPSPRIKIRRSWVYGCWVIHEWYPAYSTVHKTGTWQECVDWLKDMGVW